MNDTISYEISKYVNDFETYQNLKLLNKELLNRKFIINFDINSQIIKNKLDALNYKIKDFIKSFDIYVVGSFLNLILLNKKLDKKHFTISLIVNSKYILENKIKYIQDTNTYFFFKNRSIYFKCCGYRCEVKLYREEYINKLKKKNKMYFHKNKLYNFDKNKLYNFENEIIRKMNKKHYLWLYKKIEAYNNIGINLNIKYKKYKQNNKIINDRLTELGLDYNLINKFIIKTNGIMSGSFPLQCLLNEYWKSDIDIFVPISFYRDINHCKLINKIFKNKAKIISKTGICSFESIDKINDELYDLDDKLHYRNEKIYGIINFEYNDIIIQVIIIYNLKEFINETFDFKFCTVKYDGYRLYDYKLPINRNETVVFNKKKHILKKLLERKKKYEKRGFKIKIEK